MALVYTVTNKTNKKVYVGKTIANDIFSYWKNHIANALKYNTTSNRVFYKAIRKYGADGFDWRVVKNYCSNEEACKAEEYLILKLKTNILKYGPSHGYNMTDGGEGTSGYQHTEETKIKISSIHKGKKISKEQKKNQSIRMTGSGNGMFSKNHTDKSKNSMASNSSGPKNGMFGKTHSDSSRSKIREKRLKFNQENVLDIRKLKSSGMKIKEIALKYSSSRQTISKIISFKIYK